MMERGKLRQVSPFLFRIPINALHGNCISVCRVESRRATPPRRFKWRSRAAASVRCRRSGGGRAVVGPAASAAAAGEEQEQELVVVLVAEAEAGQSNRLRRRLVRRR